MSLRVAAVLMALQVAALPLLAGASADEAAPAPAQTPLEVAQAFAETQRTGEAGQGIDQYWDLDAILLGIFGEHLEQHTAVERTEMKRLLRDSIQRFSGDPRVMMALKEVTIEGFRVKLKQGDPNTAVVNYAVVFRGKRILNTLLLQQSGDQWRIVDSGAMGKMLVSGLKGDYARMSHRNTPLLYLRGMARAVKAG